MQQRLYQITLLLIQHGQAKATELAKRFEVSKRTIYRDIDALSRAGLPVYSQQGRGGGIRLLPGYVLDKALFSQEEQGQLLSQIQGLTALGTPDATPTLEKLSALFGKADSWLEVDFAPWGDGEEHRQLFCQLRDAILQHNTVQFTYMATDVKPAPREVEPYRLVFRGQGWYLHAFCLKRADYRFFKLTRISNLVPLGQPFTQKPAPATPAAPPNDGELVLLSCKPSLSFRVYDEFSTSSIRPQPDGHLLVEARFPLDSWLLGYLLSFGSGLEVLQPLSLRRRLLKEIYALRHNYK